MGGRDVIGGLWRYARRHHVGLAALVVAMGGTAYAAGTIGPHDIKEDAIRSRHIEAHQVRPGDLQFESVIATGSKQVDYSAIPAHSCISDEQEVGGRARRGDISVVEGTDRPAPFPSGLIISPKAVQLEPLPPPPDNASVADVPWTVCNITEGAIDPAGTVLIIDVLRSGVEGPDADKR